MKLQFISPFVGVVCLFAAFQAYADFEMPRECLVRADPGQCEDYETRFAFNWGKGRCEEFSYGGCHGNSNNFKTLEECEDKCLDAFLYITNYDY